MFDSRSSRGMFISKTGVRARNENEVLEDGQVRLDRMPFRWDGAMRSGGPEEASRSTTTERCTQSLILSQATRQSIE